MPVCQSVNCSRMTNGRIKMTTATAGASIYYSIDGGEYKKYSSPIANNAACNITAYCSVDGMIDSPKMSFDFDLYINKATWKVVSVDSEHAGNEAKLAFDNNTSTFWHTEYWGSEPTCPHTLVVDMVKIYEVTAVTYTARCDGNSNGMVKDYEVYLSLDGKTWGTAAVSGQFKNTTAQQVASLSTPTPARYMKFVAKSEINGKAWSSASEIGIQATADITSAAAVKDAATDNDLYYTLSGTATTNPSGGVFIHNGKKIVK